MDPNPVIAAHKHSIYHREELLAGNLCGCFCCLAIFTHHQIVHWIDVKDGLGRRALCPFCTIDSVIGDRAGFDLTPEFLKSMQAHWMPDPDGDNGNPLPIEKI